MKTGNHDWVEISNLTVNTHIGVFDWEQQRPRPLVIDLRLAINLQPAGSSDELDKTIDYAAVCEHIDQFAADAKFALVEAFAEQLSTRLLESWPIESAQLTITKPMAVAAAAVRIHIERSRTPEEA